ncbi:MAG: hypothetical protein K2K97_09280 [Muribaculaceae bacterium]|nr:hypothetical protein [Muribaculaceae bacterium]
MTNENETPNNIESIKYSEFIKTVERQIRRHDGIVKSRMTSLVNDFNEQFAYDAEVIYKFIVKIAFFHKLHKTISADGSDVDCAKLFLRHTIDQAEDEIMHLNPYIGSANWAVSLAHRWDYEAKKEINNIAMNLLAELEPDEE